MPELPDIEAYRWALRSRVLGEPLRSVRIASPFLLRTADPPLAAAEGRRGVGVADAPLLLWGGAEVMQPKAAAADLQLLDHRKFSVAEICAAFGVPEEIVTSINAAKYDVMRGARLSFVENRVVPLCRRLEAEEQVCVRAIEPGAKGFFEVEEHPVLASARRDRLKTAQAGFAMGIPLNELNRSLDLGFKPLPWGDVGYVPAGMRRVDG